MISALSASARTRPRVAAFIREKLSARSCPSGRGAEKLPPTRQRRIGSGKQRAEKTRQAERFNFGDAFSADYDIKKMLSCSGDVTTSGLHFRLVLFVDMMFKNEIHSDVGGLSASCLLYNEQKTVGWNRMRSC